MIQVFVTTAPAGSAPLDSLIAQLQSFAAGVLSLDPQQAAIRAGLTLLVVIGAALLVWGLRLVFKTRQRSRHTPGPDD